MNNRYTRAVDYLTEILAAYGEACELNQLSLPNIESGIDHALRILKSHQDYDGRNPEFIGKSSVSK